MQTCAKIFSKVNEEAKGKRVEKTGRHLHTILLSFMPLLKGIKNNSLCHYVPRRRRSFQSDHHTLGEGLNSVSRIVKHTVAKCNHCILYIGVCVGVGLYTSRSKHRTSLSKQTVTSTFPMTSRPLMAALWHVTSLTCWKFCNVRKTKKYLIQRTNTEK